MAVILAERYSTPRVYPAAATGKIPAVRTGDDLPRRADRVGSFDYGVRQEMDTVSQSRTLADAA
jgi:hypothetical protein